MSFNDWLHHRDIARANFIDPPYLRMMRELPRYAEIERSLYLAPVQQLKRALQEPAWWELDMLNSSTLQTARMLIGAHQELALGASGGPAAALSQVEQLKSCERFTSPPMASLSASILRAIESPAYRAYFGDSTAGQLLDLLEHVETAPSPSARAQAFDDVVAWLQATTASLPRSWLTFRAMFWLVFTVIIPLYTLADDHLDDAEAERWRQRHEAQFDSLAASIHSLKPTDSAEGLYIVAERLRLRTEPTTEADVVLVLPHNTLIRQVRQQGKWLEVEFFNYIDSKLHRGWVYKRHLVPVENLDEG